MPIQFTTFMYGFSLRSSIRRLDLNDPPLLARQEMIPLQQQSTTRFMRWLRTRMFRNNYEKSWMILVENRLLMIYITKTFSNSWTLLPRKRALPARFAISLLDLILTRPFLFSLRMFPVGAHSELVAKEDDVIPLSEPIRTVQCRISMMVDSCF